MKKISDTKILLIGLGLSIILHGIVFLVLANIKSPEKPEKKEKIVYINILKPEKKKNAVPKPKKKIPIGQHKKKVINPAPKPKPKPPKPKPKPVKPKPKKPKPIKHKPKPIKPKPRPKPVKKPKTKPKPQPKPVEKPQPQPQPPKKEIIQPVEQQPKTETKDTTEQNKNVSQNQNFNLSSLKGKELIYQHGEEEKKEKKKTDENIQAYIRALEEYLNELARRKDLYPPMAKRLRIEGSLIVRFTIKADGSVDENSIKIVESSNYSVLDKGAVKIIKKYVPLFAKKYGKKPPKGDLTVELPVTFEIIGW
ncbi:energy transducer TonB [Persephonella sp.]|uniref:energy transducer TonB n=1 Tax=Persephonella sp. TaxID=2060922 RepID=UPI00260D49F1|nr:energy transducer TonB [Persephonella sp.]